MMAEGRWKILFFSKRSKRLCSFSWRKKKEPKEHPPLPILSLYGEAQTQNCRNRQFWVRFGIAGRRDGFLTRLQAGPLMVRAYLSVRATGGAVFFPMRGENTRERWSPFKGEGDGGCSKIQKKNFWIFFWYFAHLIVLWAHSKILSFENTKEKFFDFLLVFCSLNRIFEASLEGTFARKWKENKFFFCILLTYSYLCEMN